MDALVDEAHRLRKTAAAHAHGAEAAKVAIRAGIDSIEHGSFLDDEAVRMMKEKGTYLVPTAMAVEYTGRRPRNYPPEIAAKARAAADAHSAALKRAVAAGREDRVRHRLRRQPARAQRRGVRPARAARRPHARGARCARRGVRRAAGHREGAGTLEPGKQADVIAVPGDVLADVRATEKVLFVMKGGQVYRNDRAARSPSRPARGPRPPGRSRPPWRPSWRSRVTTCPRW